MRLLLLINLHFICISIDAIKSELLYAYTFQIEIVRIWAQIKLSPFYYKANALTNWKSVEIGNHILIYINIKRVFQMGIDYTRC